MATIVENASNSGPRLRLVHAGRPAGRPAVPPGVAATQGTLALAFDLPTGVPARPERPSLHLVPDALTDAETGELKAWAGQLGLAFVEVLAGLRPASQLVRWTSQQVGRQLARYEPRRGAAATRPDRPAATRAQVTSVHLDRTREGVVEAAVILRQAGRVRATALRLESVQDRWVCTAVSVG